MKLFLLINDKPGGAEQVYKQLVDHYLRNGDKILVAFYFKKSTEYWSDMFTYPNFEVKYFNKSLPLLYLYLIKIKKSDYIFTTHAYLTGFVGFLVKFKLIKKCILVNRESTVVFDRFKGLKKYLYLGIYKLGYGESSLLICQTDDMLNKLIHYQPQLIDTNVRVLYNPINLNAISTSNFKYTEFDGNKFIVTAGRLIYEKGYDILLDAFSSIKKRTEYVSLKLIILGEGKEKNNLVKKVESLNLSGDVIFEGFVENVYPYFKKASLCVVSSRTEGFPNVLLQMMTQNVKVVSTNCAGGIDEIPGLFIAETANVESLAEAILNAFNYNDLNSRFLFDCYLEKRSIEKFADKIEYFLNEKK